MSGGLSTRDAELAAHSSALGYLATGLVLLAVIAGSAWVLPWLAAEWRRTQQLLNSNRLDRVRRGEHTNDWRDRQ